MADDSHPCREPRQRMGPVGTGEHVRCAACGKIFAARIPTGGDGSALWPFGHKDNGAKCIGSYEPGVLVQREDKDA